jgi:hypothetical protein
MEAKPDVTWRIFGMYMLIIFLMLLTNASYSQISVSQFNASWNDANEVTWVNDLSDCQTLAYVDIAANPKMQVKHKIAAIPTIIIFKDGVEVARFQADLSFKMMATREEVQEEIDNILMSDF